MLQILFKQVAKLSDSVDALTATLTATPTTSRTTTILSTGEDGEPGPMGPMGVQGVMGPMGYPGPPGQDGEDASNSFPQGDTLTGTRPTAFGGTGKNTWTAGSVAFAGTDTLAEDNANFFWDDANNRLGVGTAAPGSGTNGGGTAYSLFGTTKIHMNGGMFLIVPSSAVPAQGAMFDAQNLANGSNMFFFDAPTGWTGQYFAANLNGVQKFGVSEAGNASYAGTLSVTGVSTFGAPVKLKGYTVATLPAGVTGYVAYCTDLLAPTFLTAATGGGAVVGPVFYNGANWVTI